MLLFERVVFVFFTPWFLALPWPVAVLRLSPPTLPPCQVMHAPSGGRGLTDRALLWFRCVSGLSLWHVGLLLERCFCVVASVY